MNTLMEMLPFFVLGALGIATFAVASSARRSALRAEKLGEDRFELLRDQQVSGSTVRRLSPMFAKRINKPNPCLWSGFNVRSSSPSAGPVGVTVGVNNDCPNGQVPPLQWAIHHSCFGARRIDDQVRRGCAIKI